MYSSKEIKHSDKTITAAFKKNRIRFRKLKGKGDTPISPSFQNYLFSLNNHSMIQKMIKEKEIPNPKENAKIQGIKHNNFKVLLKEQNSVFSLSYLKVDEHVFSALKQIKTKKELVYFDFTGLYFPNFSFFKHFPKLSNVRTLCLHECGLTEIPPDLINIPKHLVNLDLSCNYISSLPEELHWRNLEGLNLSHNAFDEWPNNLNSTNFPMLKGLNISFNNINSINNNDMKFDNLLSLDLSFTNLESFPSFISDSVSLKSLILKGNKLLDSFSLNSISELKNLEYLDIGKIKTSETEKGDVPESLKIII